MKREADLVKKLTRMIEGAGGFVAKYHGGRFSRAGVPDLHIDHPLWSGWIECKFGKGELTELQSLTLRRIEESGGSVFVAYSDGRDIEIRERGGAGLMTFRDVSAEGLLRSLATLRDFDGGPS